MTAVLSKSAAATVQVEPPSLRWFAQEVKMEIVVYGPGCANCRRLEAQVRQAVATLGHEAAVTKVTDLPAMADAGVMRTPALGVNGAIVLQGRVPEVPELVSILASALARDDRR